MKNIDEKNTNCRFFPACGGCLYLDISDDEYKKIKISHLKNDLQEICNSVPDLDNIGLKSNTISEFFFIGARSRRKIILQIDKKNKLGFFAKASKNLVEVDACYIAQKEVSDLIFPLQNIFNNFETNVVEQIAITAFDNILDVIFICKRELNFAQIKKITEFARSFKINASYRIKNQITPILITQSNQIFYPNFKIELSSDIFIQATKTGLQKITETIIDFIKNKFGDRKISIADIYTGFGSYAFAVIDLAKEIYAFEGSEEMTDLLIKNAAKNGFINKIKIENRDLVLYPVSERELQKFDLAIINPPRNGATPQINKIAKSGLKNLIYVSCNPQSFVRDAKILIDSGFKINGFKAIDQFFGGKHLELVVVFWRD